MKLPNIASKPEVRGLIRRALREDVGSGDVTTTALVDKNAMVKAFVISRGDYVVSGTKVTCSVFQQVDPSLKCIIKIPDGCRARRRSVLMTVTGRARSILTAERTALNFLQKMTGIATMTSRFVEKTREYGVSILDTRKTTPTLRCLEKYAVLCGGGSNHRIGLFDRILIKDNHRRMWATRNKTSLKEAVMLARLKYPDKQIEVEVESLDELRQVLKARPAWVLLDNMSVSQMKKCVGECAGRVRLEASGGINLGNVAAVAKTHVDAISLGCLTHSASAADLSLEFA